MKGKFTKTIIAAFLFSISATGFGQIAPNLKSAADFAVLAYTEISFDGTETTIKDMDVGLYPGARSSITGDVENLNLINGVILAADDDPNDRLPDAKQDLRDAYLFAQAAPADATISGSQGGLTLAPGVYKSEESLSIEGASLTLDAGGDENAVWIFQIGSTLTTTSGGNVILAGGAKANNVYWQVGSSATIGNGTEFKGNILALVSITMGTTANIEGRTLARTGAVTFAGGGEMTEPSESEVDPGELTITKTADPQTFSGSGDEIEYTIVVENTGDATVENITVEDKLIGLFESITSLASGASETYNETYIITEADMDNGFVANIATAEAGDIFVSVYEIVTKEGLMISKVANPKTYSAEGQVIEYDIIVENTSTETMTFNVNDDLTEEEWIDITLGPLESWVQATTWTITEADMLADEVENTATALVTEEIVAEDTETISKVDAPPPPPIALSVWALVLAGILIAGFVVFQYRRSTPKRV